MSLFAMNWAWQLQEAEDGSPLNYADKLVLLALADHANERGQCFPGIARIAQRTCLTERPIRDAFRRLEDMKLLRVERSPGHSSLYFLPLPSSEAATSKRPHPSAMPFKGTPAATAGVTGERLDPGCNSRQPRLQQPATPAATADITVNEPSMNLDTPLPPASGGGVVVQGRFGNPQQGPVTKVEEAPLVTARGRRRNGTAKSLEGFDRFYAIFPLKVGEGAAEKAWPKAVAACGGDYMEIIDGLNARLHLLQVEVERGFCKHPSTWLNARCWRDAVPGAESLDDVLPEAPPALPLLGGK